MVGTVTVNPTTAHRNVKLTAHNAFQSDPSKSRHICKGSNYSTSVSQVVVHYAVFARGIYPPFHSDGGFLVHPSGDAVYSGAIGLIRRAH